MQLVSGLRIRGLGRGGYKEAQGWEDSLSTRTSHHGVTEAGVWEGGGIVVQGSDTLNSYTVVTGINGSRNSLLLMGFSYDS